MSIATLRLSRKTRRDLMWGLIFVAPWIAGFILFHVFPVVASFYYSFTDKALVNPEQSVGLANYTTLFTDDTRFLKALGNTGYMVVTMVPLIIVVAFCTALLLNVNVKGKAIYRTIYYLPTVMPPVAGSLLWLWVLNPQYGLLHVILQSVGLRGPAWFSDPLWAKPAVLLMSLWGVGGSTVLYLAALQGVSKELYESAMLDGANWLRRTLSITIPLVSPVTLFIMITSTIGVFQIFTQSYIVVGDSTGDPRESLLFYAVYLYRQGFVYLKMGYASAMAWILFVVILVATFILLRVSTVWTYYET